MDADTRALITWVLGTIVTVCFLAGAAVRYVLIPYLREHLVKPVEEVHTAVTENHHKHSPPTLPDRVAAVQSDVSALTAVLEGHLDSSDRWLTHITERLAKVEARVASLLLTSHRQGSVDADE